VKRLGNKYLSNSIGNSEEYVKRAAELLKEEKNDFDLATKIVYEVAFIKVVEEANFPK